MATGAPDKVNDYSLLWIGMLTTNQGIGSSNLSGRANKIKRLVVISADRFVFKSPENTSVVAPVVALELGFAAVGYFA